MRDIPGRNLVCIVFAVLAACATGDAPPLYEGLGSSGRRITTDSELAQEYFDQGLALCWGFNHDEAVRAFEAATRHDPDCAMAWWGIAFALGPNINLPLTDEAKARRAHRAAQRALQLAPAATEVERGLIEAVARRYADPPPADRRALDEAYAAAMQELWRRHPGDPDVGTLFAESLMLLSKEWRQLRLDGNRGPHTPEIVATLETVLADHEGHAGANHFYIHAVEASTRPERGLPSANRLAGLMPGAGHLVHMPSHIYIRVGQYDRAMDTNRRAVDADDEYFETTTAEQGIYHSYRAHNHHFQAWAAMFLGNREDAMSAAREMVAKIPTDMDRLPKSLESYLFVPVHVMMRFGMWEEILAEPMPAAKYPIAVSLWHHARGVALANLGRIDEALGEERRFEEVADTIPPDEKVRGADIASFLDLARHMMRGEIRYHEGRHQEAFAALRKAVEIEDSLPYAEPPGWMQPIRHALGALLLEQGRIEEAEVVYRADLARHADNGWSLHGLEECLRRTGREREAEEVAARFVAAWHRADVVITSSCYCRSSN